MVMLPLRATPVPFGATEYATAPLPFPEGLDVIAIQEESLAAAHAKPAIAVCN